MRVQIEGRPAPKGSRTFARTKNGKSYTFPASKHEKPWVDAVRNATRDAMRHQPPIGPPYVLDVEILIAPPIRKRKSAQPWPTQHDLDKLVRAVIDGLVLGKAIADDRHVIELHTAKRFVREGEAAGAIAYIAHADQLARI